MYVSAIFYVVPTTTMLLTTIFCNVRNIYISFLSYPEIPNFAFTCLDWAKTVCYRIFTLFWNCVGKNVAGLLHFHGPHQYQKEGQLLTHYTITVLMI